MLYKDKKYNHTKIEAGWYKFWKDNNLFEPLSYEKSERNFSIILPPPNVTGHLHLGHAWDGTIQDCLIRYKKLKGFNTIWIPGTDHAGISAQTKFDKILKQKKVNKSKWTREKYINELIKWVQGQKEYIHKQWARLGFALSYKNEEYTLDKGVSELTLNTFINLYNRGLIYQDLKLVNWDCKLQTAISDIEVIYKETKSKLYYFKYFVEGTKDFLPIATARPETMFGDTNVFVNPFDERYKKYINKSVINPINKEKIAVLADPYVDIKFGTGAMKCTPAHDFDDYRLAKKYSIHNYKTVINPDGTMNENCVFKGIKPNKTDRFEARRIVVDELKKDGLLIKIEEKKSNIGYSERTNEVVEPLLSKQWFVKMQPIVAELKKNLATSQMQIVPQRFQKMLDNWLNNIDDWCISRQLLWGHKIPFYYGPVNNQIYVGLNPPKGYKQTSEVLDTWFPSGLWPVVCTIKNKNNDCSNFYPTSILVTAYDILFFWVSRMLFQCNNLTNTIPFNNLLIHGLVRDENGKKMSKSLGNGVEPDEVIEKYGTDSLRAFLFSSATLGEDLTYSPKRLDYMSNFLNKLWNAHNYLRQYKYEPVNDLAHPLNYWICTKFNAFVNKIDKLYDQYDFSVLMSEIINFVWETYCNNYLELTHSLLNDEKFKKETIFTAYEIFKKILIVLHPICPFITENLYQIFKFGKQSIMLENWSLMINKFTNETFTVLIDSLIPIINKIRELRIKNSIKNNVVINVNIINTFLTKHSNFVFEFLKRFNINVQQIDSKRINTQSSIIVADNSLIEYSSEVVDQQKSLEKLLKEKRNLEFEISRSKTILKNKKFLANAPAAKVQLEKDKFQKYKDSYKTICKVIKKYNEK